MLHDLKFKFEAQLLKSLAPLKNQHMMNKSFFVRVKLQKKI